MATKLSKRDAVQFAASRGCLLDANYTHVEGWDFALYAPDGHVFRGQDCNVSCDIAGQGHLRDQINWQLVIDSIRAETDAGFDPEPD